MQSIFSCFSNSLTLLLKLITLCLFFGFLGSSCIPADVKGTAQTQFFDLKGFLDMQIAKLEAKQTAKEITITKKTSLEGQENEQLLKKLNWKDEFAFFYSSNINTPQLRDRYQLQKTPQRWTFKTEEEHLIVKEMQISFENENSTSVLDSISFAKVKEILILQRDKNSIYENQRKLLLKVKNGILESYSITGSEEVILNGKQAFLVEGIIK